MSTRLIVLALAGIAAGCATPVESHSVVEPLPQITAASAQPPPHTVRRERIVTDEPGQPAGKAACSGKASCAVGKTACSGAP